MGWRGEPRCSFGWDRPHGAMPCWIARSVFLQRIRRVSPCCCGLDCCVDTYTIPVLQQYRATKPSAQLARPWDVGGVEQLSHPSALAPLGCRTPRALHPAFSAQRRVQLQRPGAAALPSVPAGGPVVVTACTLRRARGNRPFSSVSRRVRVLPSPAQPTLQLA